MSLEPMPLFWLALTLAAYLLSRWLYRRTGRYLMSPLILVPALLLAVAVPLHTAYAEYSRNTHWLMSVLGPVTVAFAVPIWQQRAMLARHWPALLVGMVAGSAASIASSWGWHTYWHWMTPSVCRWCRARSLPLSPCPWPMTWVACRN